MKLEAAIEILKSTLSLPLSDSQKVILVKEVVNNLEYRIQNKLDN
ncbi:hypothetical protein [Bacillus sp. UMB0728]|nr:hypothetical protein [Bacillus sp. UMB0728]